MTFSGVILVVGETYRNTEFNVTLSVEGVCVLGGRGCCSFLCGCGGYRPVSVTRHLIFWENASH